MPNSFLLVYAIVDFIIKKLKFCKIEKEDTLLLSARDRSRDSTAKRNLSKDM